MYDPRWEQLAEILINYSTGTQSGDRVLISMLETETLPLARAVYSQAVKAGAFPYVEFHSAYMQRELMRWGNKEQVEWIPEIQNYGVAEWADVYVSIRGTRNPHEFSDIPLEQFIANRRMMGKLSALRTAHTRWVIARVPNEAFAHQAGMSLEDAETLFFSATLRDWAGESLRGKALQSMFEEATTVRVTGLDTDLTFSTVGRKYIVGDGHINMPDGEVFTAPMEDSVEGRISFEFPGVFFGQEVEGIQLEFSGGRAVSATARTNEALLTQIIHMDAGAARLGEFGIGTNRGITRYCHDHFYDEKMYGTVHFALGRSYDTCGGKNHSSLHWDIVKDLRVEGAIYLDGRLVFRNGSFVDE